MTAERGRPTDSQAPTTKTDPTAFVEVSVPDEGTAKVEPRCCTGGGLVYPDGGRRCWRHTTDADRTLVAALDARAPGVGVERTEPGMRNAYAWPYGPNVYVAMRVAMLDWAETHDLRETTRAHPCLHWVRTGRCSRWRCYDSHPGWMDHVTRWTRNGRPAVLVGQPYHVSVDGYAALALVDADPAFTVEIRNDGWYGSGVFIAVWNAQTLAGGAV